QWLRGARGSGSGRATPRRQPGAAPQAVRPSAGNVDGGPGVLDGGERGPGEGSGRQTGGDPLCGQGAAGARGSGKASGVPARVSLASGDGGADQCVEAALRAGPLPGSRRGG